MSELTNEEINEKIERLINPDIKVWYKGVHENYISDDAFCFRVMRDNKIDVDWHVLAADWAADAGVVWCKDKNLNRAVLLTYLKMKGSE